MSNTGIILSLAYPDTIVMVADEWYSPYLRYLGVGKKNYVRAGHAALVLINKENGVLEYHDFGRYITPEPNGRVRGKTTDCELDFPLMATIEEGEIKNLDEILQFLATNPKLTHGDGKLIASVCNDIDYDKARAHITSMQKKDFIRYAAFVKDACNCARFVTDSLIASVNDQNIKKRLVKSKWFTPSTVGNVLLADTDNYPYEVSVDGVITRFTGSQRSENIRCFLDRLKDHDPDFVGTLEPKSVDGLHEKAEWLSGIAAGAWFELHANGSTLQYRFRRVSPYGNIDVDAVYIIDNPSFDYHMEFEFIQYSNCAFFHVKQNEAVFRFDRVIS